MATRYSAGEVFDYIVIGGGSAGCVMTNRLVSAGHRVLLLEAGPPDNTPYIHTPATFVRVIGTKRTWVYETEPQAAAAGRTMYVPQGRTREPISLAGQDRGLNALRHGAESAFFKSGLLTSNVVESGGFFDTGATGRPDEQFHVLPVLAGGVDRAPLAGHGIYRRSPPCRRSQPGAFSSMSPSVIGFY